MPTLRNPQFDLPQERGPISVHDIYVVTGERRHSMIRRWCAGVWEAYHHQQAQVIASTEALLIKHKYHP